MDIDLNLLKTMEGAKKIRPKLLQRQHDLQNELRQIASYLSACDVVDPPRPCSGWGD